jgi:hypothetical protein
MRWRAASFAAALSLAACHSQPEAPAAKVTPTPGALQSPVPFHGKLLIAARAGQREPDRIQFENLARLAGSSCRCARGTKDEQAKAQCWSEFDSNAATYPTYSESESMCLISKTQLCFGKAGCLTKDYEGYCSKAEYEAAVRKPEDCR